MKKTIFIAIITMISAISHYQCFRKMEAPVAVEESPTAKLIIEDIKIGDKDIAQPTQKIIVHYKGMLEDGTVFANSYETGNPLITTLGIGELIPGWDQGIPGMGIGGIRKLTIPPHLGYGRKKLRNIPANSTLIFEVKLVNILHH